MTRLHYSLAILICSASMGAAAEPSAASTLSGVVVETMDASRYTYLHLDTGSSRVWVASTLVTVEAGQAVEVNGVFPMQNFHSKALNRTFDTVYFASSVRTDKTGEGGEALPVGHPEIPGYELPKGHPEVAGMKPAKAATDASLPVGHPEVASDKMSGGDAAVAPMERAAGGKTVAEIHAGKDELSGKTVAVRGMVTKVNNGILGRNWLHIKDGSGQPGSNDLTVTSATDTAKVGDTVVARGTLGLDRDFGGGYFYPVLLEKSSFDVE